MSCSNTSEQETSTDSVENEANAPSKGSRAGLLQNVMDKTIEQYTKKVRLISPIKNIPWPVLQQLQSQVIDQLKSNIKCEFEEMYVEENIENLLNGLDKLIHQSPPAENSKEWRPSGSVKRDVCPTAAKLKSELLKEVQRKLADLESQNKLLRNKVAKREKLLLQTSEKIATTVRDIEQITLHEAKVKTEVLSVTGAD